ARTRPSGPVRGLTPDVVCWGAGSARGCSSSAGATPSPPITTSTVPTGTVSPSPTRIRATLPAAGDGISTVVLSVWISTRGSSSPISCPSLTSQRAISPSVSPSPRSGSLNSYATTRESNGAASRPTHRAGRDAGDRDDAQARVLPAHRLARGGIAQPVAGTGALEPQAQAFCQNSSVFRTAATTRPTDGMYASSICQYGYGTS